jgi:hypothetical protein
VKIIRHKRFKDICFQVLFEKGRLHRGAWLNMGFVETWALPVKQSDILIDDLTQWETCQEPTVKCLRYASWK